MSIEVTVDGDMPSVGQRITVEASCDGKNDKEENAFFTKLSDAKKR